MEKRATAYFMRELLYQAEAASLAAEDLNAALARKAEGVPRSFAAVQSLLASGAMVSKILWPQPPKLPEQTISDEAQRQRAIGRGRNLRESLGIKAIPVLQSRRVRNAFEHFDDRLDACLEQALAAKVSLIIDRSVGRGTFHVHGAAPSYLRLIDHHRGTVSVLDDEVVVQELFDAIHDVASRARQWLASNGYAAP